MFSESKKNFKIGKKEVLKLLAVGGAKKVLIAGDCEERIASAVKAAAEARGVAVEYEETMRTLGKRCGIDVGASCAAEIL